MIRIRSILISTALLMSTFGLLSSADESWSSYIARHLPSQKKRSKQANGHDSPIKNDEVLQTKIAYLISKLKTEGDNRFYSRYQSLSKNLFDGYQKYKDISPPEFGLDLFLRNQLDLSRLLNLDLLLEAATALPDQKIQDLAMKIREYKLRTLSSHGIANNPGPRIEERANLANQLYALIIKLRNNAIEVSPDEIKEMEKERTSRIIGWLK